MLTLRNIPTLRRKIFDQIPEGGEIEIFQMPHMSYCVHYGSWVNLFPDVTIKLQCAQMQSAVHRTVADDLHVVYSLRPIKLQSFPIDE